MTKIRPPFKYVGGKYYLSDFIISHFPKGGHKRYVEVCGGAGSVILNKESAEEDIYNELNPEIWNIFYHLKKDEHFLEIINNIEYTENNFIMYSGLLKHAIRYTEGYAVCAFVNRRMSRGGLGKTFSWSERQRGGQPGEVNSWETMKKQLPLIKDKLQNIYLTCEDAFDCIKKHDNRNTLFYIDCPYPKSTRTAKDVYEKYDWEDDKHVQLCRLMNSSCGKFVVSSYENPIYNELLEYWRIERKEMPNHSGQGKTKQKRTEALYINY